MNLLACSAYWNSLPRSMPHFCWSETWSVALPGRLKRKMGDGREAKNRHSPHCPGANEGPLEEVKPTHTRALTRNGWKSHCLMWSQDKQQHKCVIHANQRQAERKKKLPHFTPRLLKRTGVQRSFKPLDGMWSRRLVSKSQTWHLKLLAFLFKPSGGSHLTGVGTIFERVKSSLGNSALS